MKKGVNKKISTCILACGIAGVSVSVNAGLLVNSAGKNEEGGIQVGAHYSAATTTYVADANDLKAARNGITVYGVYGVNENFDFYAGATYNMTTEVKKINGENPGFDGGSGFEFGVGVRGELLDLDGVKLMGYAQLEYITDDFGSKLLTSPGLYEVTYKYSASGMEFSVGVLGLLEVSDQLLVYGGLDLIPFGTMVLDLEYNRNPLTATIDPVQGKSSGDIERDNMLGIRAGAKYMINDEVFVRGEFSAVGEKAFIFGAGMGF